MVAVSMAAPLNLVSPYFVHHAAPVAYPVHHVAYAAPAIHTRVHYADTPVVVGHSSTILKPALTAPVAVAPFAAPAVTVVKTEEKAADEKVGHHQVKTVQFAYSHLAPLAYAAPPVEQLVHKQKVLAPVRAISDITPQVTVQHPTQINVQKYAVDVPVAAPYAHPVPVAVAAPYEIHQVHHSPALTVVA